jgi:DNA-binding transcriptional MerR regulator
MAAGIDQAGGDGANEGIDAEEPCFSITDLATEFGVSLRTLRFYEYRGMLLPSREDGVRRYSMRDRDRLVTILQGKQLGFTLGQIAEILVHTDEGGGAGLNLSLALVERQQAALENQKREIEEGLNILRSMHARLAARLSSEEERSGQR